MSSRKLIFWTTAAMCLTTANTVMAQDSGTGAATPNMLSLRGSETDEAVMMATEHGLAIRQSKSDRKRSLKKGALSGKRISLSPGHGIEYDGGWGFQRGIVKNLREDKHTYEWVHDYIRPMLERAGAETLMMRAYSYTESATQVKYTDSGNYKETGTWEKSSSGDYRYSYVTSAESSTATWSFKVEKDGVYPVYARYYTSDNRAPDAQYTIKHARGESIVKMDHSHMGVKSGNSNGSEVTKNSAKTYTNEWHFMGDFPFKAGVTYEITLSNISAAEEGKKVVIADAIQVGDGAGTVSHNGKSGQNKWQECAETWFEFLGIRDWVLTNDVSGRSLYSLYEGVDAQLSVHTNAGGGVGSQTYVWYPDDANGNMQWAKESWWTSNHGTVNLPPGTYNYAKHINRRFLEYIRKYVDASFSGPDDLYGSNFGELRPARNAWYYNQSGNPLIIPATLVEAAFHDHDGDTRLIREQTWRFWGARGMIAGIIQHFKNDDNAVIPPLPPSKLTMTADADHVSLSWEATKDLVLTNSVPTKYNIYTSDDGLLFDVDPLLTVTEPKAEIPILHGQTLYVRVTAVNDGGESFDSITVAARLPNKDQKKVLYIDGVDREIKCAYDANNDRTYARIYAPAIVFNNAGYGLDSVDDEAAAALLSKNKYDMVIWATGPTADAQDVLPAEQRNAIKDLRAKGTPLVISGADIGYAMALSSYNSDSTWLANTLNAGYVADEAYSNITAVQKVKGSDVISGEVIYSGCLQDGGSATKKMPDAACVLYPDVLKGASGGTEILNYIGSDGASSNGAAILSADGKSIFVGFPLETIVDPNQRLCVIANLLAKVSGTTINTNCTAAAWTPDPEICDNKLDDDGNGKADCDDDACKNTEACKAPEPKVEICGNNIDDDENGKTDCDDDACKNTEACKATEPKVEICGNNIDDDENGKTDCDDDACKNTETCKTTNPDEPTQNPDDPTQNPDDPTQNPDDPTKNPDDPTKNPDDPNENPDDPNEDPDVPDGQGYGKVSPQISGSGSSDCSIGSGHTKGSASALLLGILGLTVLRRRKKYNA